MGAVLSCECEFL